MVQPIQTAGALAGLSGGGGRASGKTSAGSNYWWNDTAFRQQIYQRARVMLTNTAQEAAQYASSEMQNIPGPATSGEFPAIQSGNLQNAIDGEFFYENRRWMVARFGVYGRVKNRSQADFSGDYDDETPVGTYAYTLATGVGRQGKRWPWVQKTLQHVADEGWVDAEVGMNVVRDYAGSLE